MVNGSSVGLQEAGVAGVVFRLWVFMVGWSVLGKEKRCGVIYNGVSLC